MGSSFFLVGGDRNEGSVELEQCLLLTAQFFGAYCLTRRLVQR